MKASKTQVKKAPARKVAKRALPTISLTPDVRRVKQNGGVAVTVAFTGLDEVEFALEPRGAFTLDLASMTKAGVLRLRGKKDGTATIVARGKLGAKIVHTEVLHIQCEGPIVRILACGYIPFEG